MVFKNHFWNSHCGSAGYELTLSGRMRVHPWPHSVGLGSGIATSCSIGQRCALDPVLLWLFHRPETAALITLLAWGLPYAAGAVVKRIKKNKIQQEKKS